MESDPGAGQFVLGRIDRSRIRRMKDLKDLFGKQIFRKPESSLASARSAGQTMCAHFVSDSEELIPVLASGLLCCTAG